MALLSIHFSQRLKMMCWQSNRCRFERMKALILWKTHFFIIALCIQVCITVSRNSYYCLKWKFEWIKKGREKNFYTWYIRRKWSWKNTNHAKKTGAKWNFPASPFKLKFKMADTDQQNGESADGNFQNEEATAGRLTQFPQTRVRNMMKIDPDLHLANRESVFLLTKSAVS